MKILSVETATGRQSVAVLDGEQVLARADRDAPGTHAKTLVSTIDGLFASSGLSFNDLNGLVVSIGPGSFTGLRVGLATMLGFRLVTGLPLTTVPTLEGLAWNLRRNARPICTVLKARTDEVYWALYRWRDIADGGGLECLSPPRVDRPARLPDALTVPVTVLGDGWMAYRDDICSQGARQDPAGDARDAGLFEAAPPEAMWPSAVSVGLAGYVRFARGEIAGARVTPLYVQRAEAEVMWEAKQLKSAGGGVIKGHGR